MRQTLKSACGRKNVLILSFWLLAVIFICCSVFFIAYVILHFFVLVFYLVYINLFFFYISNVICSVYRHYFTQSISVFPFQHLSYLKRSLVSFINNHSANKFNINENKNFDVNSCSNATKETKKKKRNNNDNNHKVNKENRQHI